MKKRIFASLICIAILCGSLSVALAFSTESPTAIGGRTFYALVLDEYTIPNCTSEVRVTDPNGKSVEINGGKFRMLSAGEYKIEYPGRTVTVAALLRAPSVTLSVVGTFPEEVEAGRTVLLPDVRVSNGCEELSEYRIEVTLAGEVFETIPAREGSPVNYTFLRSGNYIFRYLAEDGFGTRVTEERSCLCRDVELLILEERPASISYGEKVEIGFPYGYFKGNIYPVEVKLRTASGERVLSSPHLTVEETGKFVFTFSAVVGDKTLTETWEYEVDASIGKFAYLSGTGSIREVSKLPEFAAQQSAAVLAKSDSSSATFAYLGILDLNTLTKQDNLIQFLPYASGTDKMNGIRLTLTDLYDPDNSVSVRWWQNPWGAAHSYCGVAFEDGGCYGFSNESKNFGELRKDYGSVAYDTSFAGDSSGQSKLFNLQYDLTENALYIRTNAKGVETQWKVLDLDDASVLDGDHCFKGFRTGEVLLTLTFEANSGAGVYVTEVSGMPAGGLADAEELSKAILLTEPGELPAGAVGKSYPLPEVRCSLLAELPVRCKVTLGNEDVTKNVKDGVFLPTAAGTYTLEYSADYHGMRLTRRLELTVGQEAPQLVIGLPQEMSVSAGEVFRLPDIQVAGGSGKKSVQTRVFAGEKEIVPDQYGYYSARVGCDLTVKITARDFLGTQASAEFLIDVTEGGWIERESAPVSLRAGRKFDIEEFFAFYFDGTRLIELTPKLLAAFDGGAESVLSEDAVVPVADTCRLVFAGFDGEVCRTTEIFELSVLPVQGQVSELLIGNTADTFMLESGICLGFPKQGGYSFGMPHAVALHNLSVRFALHENSAPDTFSLILTEPESGEKVELNFSDFDFSTGTLLLRLNGGDTLYKLTGTFNTYGNACAPEEYREQYAGKRYWNYEISLEENEICAGSVRAEISAFVSQNKFEGFGGDTIKVDFRFEAQEGEEFVLSAVSNQSFSYFISLQGLEDDDNQGPVIVLAGGSKDVFFLPGDTLAVGAAKAYDVLQGAAVVRVTVKTPDGEIFFSGAADQLREYTLESYGVYQILYESNDFLGKRTETSIVAIVKDVMPPDIKIFGQYEQAFSVGKKIGIASAEAEDNVELESLRVLIRTPDLGVIEVRAGDEYVFSSRGRYEIIYRAEDKSRNVTRVVFSIMVE